MKFKEYSFRELLSKIVDNRGRTCPTAEDGIPLIATNCIKNTSLYPVYEKIRYVSKDTYDNWFRGHPEPGDMIFVCKGSPGRVCWVPDPIPFCIAQDMVAIRADENVVYPRYLFALLRSKDTQGRILNMHVGSLIPHFKKGDFANLYLEIPSDMEYQKQVGDLYMAFCEKIDANHKINQTLEQIAQAIFKSWFVDFEPVKAKIAALEAGGSEEDVLFAAMQAISGKGEPELTRLQAEQPEQYAELRATAELFPSALQNSELEEIPEGWNISHIGDEVLVVGGGTPSTKNPAFWEAGEINWTSPKDLSNLADKILVETERKITAAGLAKISSGLLPVDTVLMSSRAPVGYLAMAKIPVAVNQGYIAMKCQKTLSPEFVIQWCEAHMDEIKSRASGTTFEEISKKNFKIIPLVIPPEPLISIYSKQVSSLYEAIKNNAQESDTLEKLRDSLLPKLLSGELSVIDDLDQRAAEPRRALQGVE
ncbi:restriction endonuclease subunit S [Marinobacter adhaerens]|jgi:type I restriction enzyme S subunit|uniref:restriction endonuclease subunit S n=1 Tax=Marinobacter adhaerens TaxID=1033846 RepID=UPI001C5E0098|nr:restriction endonuclease subunit S [Marinobacter adhaerens]MBW4980612.1 restriction endonuclease subunit S [Marinobacter adhaerens]